jgi:uncharacterized membrane protein
MAALAYWLLARAIVAKEGPDGVLARAIGKDRKGAVSVLLYLLAVALAFVSQWAAQAIYVAVALAWLIPDRRIERVVKQ